MRPYFTPAGLLALAAACTSPAVPAPAAPEEAAPLTVAETPSRAQAADGRYISWAEHRVDDEGLNGGVPIRGGDGLKMADLDLDGYLDIVSVHEDSDHVRIAFGTADPDTWSLVTLASGDDVGAVEDVAVGDLNGDGLPDLVFACERGHVIYFENPGTEKARSGNWPHLIPQIVQGRGSWLRVFLADMDGDGKLEVLAANKGGVDIVDVAGGELASGPVSAFHLDGPPLEDASWREVQMFEQGPANNAMPADIDADGDADVIVADREAYQTFILENTGQGTDGMRAVPLTIAPPPGSPEGWTGMTNAFHAAVPDLNQDGRPDIALNVIEQLPDTPALSFGWLEQPAAIADPWPYHRIGDILPDWITGFAFTDIDGDGDLDVITGGYSGLNILAGSYSGASRDHDDPAVTAADTTGRIAWFQNPGDDSAWPRHDISRRVRGMYDEFLPRDVDGDGDMDFVATRGNSGTFDGVFWLEQVRTDAPRRAFTSRPEDSRALPLPPENWPALYTQSVTMEAPNLTEE